MRLCLTCQYCGHKFEKEFYTKVSVSNTRCPVCKDKNLNVKDIDSLEKLDQYKDDSAFPVKQKDTDDYDGYL